MNYLIKNKKITVGILVIIIIISICYYIYSENTNFLSIQEQNLEIDEQELENSSMEDNNTVNAKMYTIILCTYFFMISSYIGIFDIKIINYNLSTQKNLIDKLLNSNLFHN